MIGVIVRRERRWTLAGATPAQKASMASGFKTGKAVLALNPKPAFGFTSAAKPIALQAPKPRSIRDHSIFHPMNWADETLFSTLGF
jgi:hypothetical protein